MYSLFSGTEGKTGAKRGAAVAIVMRRCLEAGKWAQEMLQEVSGRDEAETMPGGTREDLFSKAGVRSWNGALRDSLKDSRKCRLYSGTTGPRACVPERQG